MACLIPGGIIDDVVFEWDTKQFPKTSHRSALSMSTFRTCTRLPRQPGSAWVWSLTKDPRRSRQEHTIQMVFSSNSATVVCVILDSTSGLKPWSVMTAPRYLKSERCSIFRHWPWCQCWCHLCKWSSVWSSLHYFPCQRQKRSCPGDPLERLVPPLVLPNHQCHRQNVSWWLFCLRCWLFCDLPVRYSSGWRSILILVGPCTEPEVHHH